MVRADHVWRGRDRGDEGKDGETGKAKNRCHRRIRYRQEGKVKG
jgi:hypothetical protein